MRCIRDQLSDETILKWPSRLLDGSKDVVPMGSLKDDTLIIESAPDGVRDRFASIFKELTDKPRFAENSSLVSSDENPQQIMAFREITASTCPSSSLSTFYRNDFATDYLPFLRSMAAMDKEKKAASGRRRRRHLHEIGLDDRAGRVQAVLEDNPFE